MKKSFSFLELFLLLVFAAILCLFFTGCALTPQTVPVTVGTVIPANVTAMGPVPAPVRATDTAGLFSLTVDLYDYAGECRRRLATVLAAPPNTVAVHPAER
jgi:hypothetical protein